MSKAKVIALVSIIIAMGAYLFLPYPASPPLFEKLICLIYFIALTYFLGYTVTLGKNFSDDIFEKIIMRFGAGVAAFPLFIVLAETIFIPLNWILILALAMLYPLSRLLKKHSNLKIPSINVYAAASLLIASSAFLLALNGSFAFPYLEDGDSWEHAAGTKYVKIMQRYTQPDGIYVGHYLPPYPPTYDALMGLIHQLNSRIQWTLKAFNAVLIALGYVFAFFLFKRLTCDERISLMAVFFLSITPGFSSHTIWSHTLSITAIFPIFYFIDRAREDKKLTACAIFLLASSMIIQPLMSMVVGIFYILYALSVNLFSNEKIKWSFTLGLMGLLLSMVFWLPAFMKDGTGVINLDGVKADFLSKDFRVGLEDSQKTPSFLEIVFPDAAGDMYMQEGIGIGTSIYVILGFFMVLFTLTLKLKMRFDGISRNNNLEIKSWHILSLLWFIYCLVSLLSYELPISIYPGRFWGLIPIPASLLAAFSVNEMIKQHGKRKASVLAILLLFAFLGAAPYKMVAQSGQWPSDLGVKMDGEIQSYVNLLALPPETMVYSLCLGDQYVIGMDAMSPRWKPGIQEFRKDVLQKDSTQVLTFLKDNGFKYLMVESYCVESCARSKGGDEYLPYMDSTFKYLKY
jgi:hypothetical protein